MRLYLMASILIFYFSASNSEYLNDDKLSELKSHEIDKKSIESDKVIRVIKNPFKHNYPIKYCTDLRPIKEWFLTHIEPYYDPLIDLLPDEYQQILREETRFAGFNIASCLLCSCITFSFFLVWYLVSKSVDNKKIKLKSDFTEKILCLNLKLKELKLNNEIYEYEIYDLQSKLSHIESNSTDYEKKLEDYEIKYLALNEQNNGLNRELENYKQNEDKLTKELKKVKSDLNELNDKYSNQKSDLEQTKSELKSVNQLLIDKSSEIYDLNKKQDEINELINQKDNEILKLSKSVLDQTNVYQLKDTKVDSVMKIAELKSIINELETEIKGLKSSNESVLRDNLNLNQKLTEKDVFIKSYEKKQLDLESLIKENEMQIKLLNELRDKDTKQYIKSFSELESQLKKKSIESEKMTHLYDQLRSKQERLQELEIQLGRVEKQSNQERQTFEKQAHENWLNARKFEKELKETKLELSNLKERFNLQTNETILLKNKSGNYSLNQSQLDVSPELNNDSKVDQPLQIDTNNLEQSRPSSATSSSSGFTSGIGGPVMPSFDYIKQGIRYPFPIPLSPNIPFIYPTFQHSPHQHIMHKLMMQHQQFNANSSQLPSPGSNIYHNIPSSASCPNNVSMLNNLSSIDGIVSPRDTQSEQSEKISDNNSYNI